MEDQQKEFDANKYADSLGFDVPKTEEPKQEAPSSEPVKEEPVQDNVQNEVPETVQNSEQENSQKEEVLSNSEEKETIKTEENPYSINLFDEDEPKSESKPTEQPDLNDQFKEKYADLGVESVDDLVAKYNELKESKPELPEGYEKLSSLLSNGEVDWNKIKEIAEVKTMDVDNMAEKEILKKYYESQNLTPKEIELNLRDYDKLKSKDKEDLYDDELDNYEREEARLERTLRDAKKELSSLKDKEEYDLPTISNTNNSKELEEQQAQLEKLKKEWEGKVQEEISDFNKMSFNLDKDTTYDFDIDQDVKSSIQTVMSDIGKFYDDYVQDGNVNFKAMQQDLFMAKNWKSVVKSLIAQSTNKGKEEVVKEINNVDFSQARATKDSDRKLSKTEEHILKSLL